MQSPINSVMAYIINNYFKLITVWCPGSKNFNWGERLATKM